MAAHFDLHKTDRGQFVFALKSADGGTLLRSETYESKASAESGIASVRKNAILPERYDPQQASDGRFYFNLKAANHQIIGTSPMFGDAAKRDAAIAATQNDAERAPTQNA